MSTTAPISPIPPDVTPAQAAPGVTPAATSQTPAQKPASASAAVAVAPSQGPASPIAEQTDLRLVIEEDKAAGSYVYMTVDPRTGKVISQIPREELLKMRDTPGYQPGSVVNSRS